MIGVNDAVASFTFNSWIGWCTEEDRRYSVMGGIGLESYRMALADFFEGLPRGSPYFLRRYCAVSIIINNPGISLGED